MTCRTIVWFREKDLRLADHAPLNEALSGGESLLLFVLNPELISAESAKARPNHMQFLLDSLSELQRAIAERGSRLLVVRGKSLELVPRLVREWKADVVVAHRLVEPAHRELDRRLQESLGEKYRLYEGETLLPPGALRTQGGTPYAVFTHFARAFREHVPEAHPLPAPRKLPPPPAGVAVPSVPLPTPSALELSPNPSLACGGEQAARGRLRRFIRDGAQAYSEHRDRMDLSGTSRLSADFKFGTLSPRQVWTAVDRALGDTPAARSFLNELVWREFSYSTLWDRPELLEQPFRPGFIGFPWRNDESLWRAWVEGKTGYPIVDAASRQLLGEGFVHNRARMVSASFLTKHLLIDYRRGEAHYMKYLTDGDEAQNNAGWQWSAGCGCDAQPYFRIFNPVTQGKKFDPTGDYVRRWLPELRELPARYIHSPWETPQAALSGAGVRLGVTYPAPVIDHRFARERFLEFATVHLRR